MISNDFIGLSGWAKSGKDTIANYLVENHGYKKVSFADPMREALLRLNPGIALHGLSAGQISLQTAVRLMGWDDLKRSSLEVRELLQRMGTEVGREMFGKDFWVDLAVSKIQPGDKVVFADVRYPNEAEAVKRLGGIVVRVVREGVEAPNDHSSEHSLNDYKFDVILHNNGTIEDLWSNVLLYSEAKFRV